MSKVVLPEDFVAQLQAFEKELDGRLDRCAVYGMDPGQSLSLLVSLSDVMAQKQPVGNLVDAAIDVFAPYLVTPATAPPADLEALVADLSFASHYYMLREYLYYAWNVPGAFDWTFTDERVEIRFRDKSIPRQFFTSSNESSLGARDHFSDKSVHDALAAKIPYLQEWASAQDDEVIQLLEAEARHKLTAYFTIIAPDATIDLGGFSYAEFFSFYELLVAKALWHRHHAAVSGARGAVWMDEAELVASAHERLGIEPAKLHRMLKDLVYDTSAVKKRVSPIYFSLLRDGTSGQIAMRPVHFCVHEGVVGFLRVMALRRSNHFLAHVSGPLGDGLGDRMEAAFVAQGFRCLREVDLTPFDPALPDIDLLVISEEPTLGYVILVCELKSPVPSQWAKDHLRALNDDGVSKAFRQCEKIAQFLTTEHGLELMLQWLPDGLLNFDHFVVVLEPLIITSHSGGMLFENESTPMFSYHTLERMLRASDGDIAYIQHMLRSYNGFVDAKQRTRWVETGLLTRQVAFEMVDPEGVINFPPNQWRTSGHRDEHIRQFIASGVQPGASFAAAFASAIAAAPGRGTGPVAETAGPAAETSQGLRSADAVYRKVILFDSNVERMGSLFAQIGDATGQSSEQSAEGGQEASARSTGVSGSSVAESRYKEGSA